MLAPNEEALKDKQAHGIRVGAKLRPIYKSYFMNQSQCSKHLDYAVCVVHMLSREYVNQQQAGKYTHMAANGNRHMK